jgi:hypothetical protein
MRSQCIQQETNCASADFAQDTNTSVQDMWEIAVSF